MSTDRKDFLVPANAFRLPAARLHGRYLHREVMVTDPNGELRVIGHLESIKLRNQSGSADFHDNYEVTLRISGYKMKVSGDTEIVFLDDGAEDAP